MKAKEIKKHLMTGVSYMIPVVVAGGICMAIAKILGGALVGEAEGTVGFMINQIGAAAMVFVVPVLTAAIAYSIAERPGIAPGLVLGFIATEIKAGFIGGIIAAFLLGYVINFMKTLKLPNALRGLMPILFIPVMSTLIVGSLFYLIIGNPIAALQDVILNWMTSLQGGSRFFMGAIIGGMSGFDMGGPLNKTAALFANGLLAEGIYAPTAAKIVGGMTPPLGVALAVLISGKKKYNQGEIEAAKAAFPLGLCYITEGVLPFAAADPLRVIPACSIGSAIASGLTMVWNVQSTVPHGGIFVVPLMGNWIFFVLALVIGSCVTAAILYAFKPNLTGDEQETEDEKGLEHLNIDF